MSLSKIGKLTSAFSSFKNNPLDLTNIATALASVGNVDSAAKYLVRMNKQNGSFLGENAMAVLLSKAYRSSGVNQEMAMGSINNALANSSKFSTSGILGSLSDLIHEIQVNQYRKSRLEKNRSDYSDSYWSDYQKEEREIAAYAKTINSKKSDLSDLMTTISDTSQDFWDEQGNLVDESTKDTADKVKKLANDYTSITGVSDIDSKMNNLFARSQFKDVKDQLLDIGKKQGSKGIESKIDEIDGLKAALDDAGISVDDFTSELMAMADPDAKNPEGIKENLKDIFGEIKDADGNSLYDFFKDKSNKDIEGYYDYFLNQGLNPQTSDYTWKKEDIENSYNDYLKSKKSIEAESKDFSSLFKNSSEDTATDLDTVTDNFQTDMSNIKSSMDSIKSGTFQNSDITDLIQQFPELATETDDLQQGLQNLAFDKASDAIGKIRDSVKDVTDPKELAAADKYVQSIMDTMDLSRFDMSNAKSTILGNLTKNLCK